MASAGVAFDNASELHAHRGAEPPHLGRGTICCSGSSCRRCGWSTSSTTYFTSGAICRLTCIAVGHLAVQRGIATTTRNLRNSLFISALRNRTAGVRPLCGWRPPRYMQDFGFTDPIVHAQSYYTFAEPEDREPVRGHAEPALQVGVLVAIAIGTQVRFRGLKLFAAFHAAAHVERWADGEPLLPGCCGRRSPIAVRGSQSPSDFTSS